MGQVSRPSLKSDAEAAVKKIEGVESVENQIEVLPASPMDDQLRRAEFHAIYSQPALQRYALGAVPPIHIIVKNGLQASGVSGVFSVTNNLRVEEHK
jgi:hyperosmotically inducible protein